MKIVVCKFRDATTYNQWVCAHEIESSEARVCYAHGRLLEENDDVVKVALLSSDDGKAWSNWIVIPRSIILSVEVLKDDDDNLNPHDLQES